MQIDVEIPEDIDNSGMKGKPKSDKQQIPKDDNLILLSLSTISFPRAHNVPIIRFFCRDATSPSSIRLRPKVYVFGISFATVSRLRFRAMTTNYRETKRCGQTKEGL
jgi:hypothetical protein